MSMKKIGSSFYNLNYLLRASVRRVEGMPPNFAAWDMREKYRVTTHWWVDGKDAYTTKPRTFEWDFETEDSAHAFIKENLTKDE